MLEEAGIIAVDGDAVSFVADWLEKLEGARQAGEEIEAEELARHQLEIRREAFHGRHKVKADKAPTHDELREQRESYPERRRAAIKVAMARLFAEHPEARGLRVGQITCRLPWYLPDDFPRGPDGAPKDAEVEALCDGVVARPCDWSRHHQMMQTCGSGS
jgi:hypothetical protein